MVAQTRFVDYGARQYDPTIARWNGMDPMADKYPSLTQYGYCGGNPVTFIDPIGNDWYRTNSGEVRWTELKSQQQMDDNNISGTYLGVAHLEFRGNRYERLGTKNGKYGYIDGDGAINADVTLYGPNGEDDIYNMTGYTMTSNAEKFGPVDEGLYKANYDIRGKGGSLRSHWVLNNRGPVRMLDGIINPNAPSQIDPVTNEGFKNGIFIHSAWIDGLATGQTSTGCLLLMPKDFETFNRVMKGVNSFTVQVTRSTVKTIELNGVTGFVKYLNIMFDKQD